MDDFAAVVQRHMDSRGMSVRATARAAGYSDHTLLSKVLNGHKPITPYLAAKLDRALEADGEIIAAAEPSIKASTTRSTNILGNSLESLRQQMNAVFSRGSVSDTTLDDWERTAIRYARATRDRPASLLIADLGRDLHELNGMLANPLPATALRRLTRVAAQMSGLMCLAFCILDDRPAFRRWARTARLAGGEAGDRETLAWVLAQEAHGHYYSGDVLEAIDVARHAYETSPTPCTGTALGAALEARAQATLGRNEETRNALARAEDALAHLGGDVLVPSAFGYNEASFRFHEGNAYTHLHDVKPAFRAQERALVLCSPDNYTDWAMTRLDRAQCLIYADEIADGLEYAIETLTSLDKPKRQGIIALRAQEITRTVPKEAGSLAAARDIRELLTLTSGTSEAHP
jgi:plasmid maintenance system antidote protein VapI